MDALEESTIGKEQVRGAGEFPAYFILVGFVVFAVGMWVGSIAPSVIGAVMLLTSVVGIENITGSGGANAPKRVGSRNGVPHHA